jgi:Flp pilus assembly protein CpaB
MAEEERGGVQNLWLLLIALGLGLVVVIIYNVHIYRVRQEGRGKTIRLLRVTRDMEPGDKIAPEDLEVQPIPKQFEASLGNVVDEENFDFAVGSTINQGLEKSQWLQWGHITKGDTVKPASAITKGNVAVTVPLDSTRNPGNLLRQNDRVNLLGLIGSKDAGLKTFRIIEGVRVLAIGGVALSPQRGPKKGPKTSAGVRTYRSVTVEVDPKVSIELNNILTHMDGPCWLELRSPNEGRPKNAGQINPALKDLGQTPKVAKRAGSGFSID